VPLLVGLVKLAHVFAGFWLVAGLVGRGVTQVRAERTADIGTVKVLVELIGRFDSLMVIPASTAVLALGLLAAWIEGLPILGFLQGAHTNWLLVALVLYLSIMVLVPTVFIPRGKRFGATLDDAIRAGGVTDRLKAAFRDPVVRAAHVWELVAIALIIWLMILKPI
jgi:uncharacterized membrane protein